MADDSHKNKFKSKWNRVFKEKEEHEVKPHHVNSFKLDDDVSDFLKPSTDKAASTRPGGFPAPKIDIALAKRWPEANDVKKASTTPSGSGQWTPNGFQKPKRRKGLTVGFVRAEPEIIGEGGDECEDAASVVRKAVVSRSYSERRPSAMGTSTTQRQARSQEQMNKISVDEEEDFVPGPLKRAHTSHNEVSAPVQKQMSPPIEEQMMNKPKLSRTPTGFGSQDSIEFSPSHDMPPQIPPINTDVSRVQSSERSAAGSWRSSPSPRDPSAIAAKKRDLISSEGMSLRRASAMIVDEHEDDESKKRESLAFGVRPPQQLYDTLSRPDAQSLMPDVPEPRSARSPASATIGVSPFADPKYIKRHSREVTPEEQSQAVRQRKPGYEPSYVRAARSNSAAQPAPQSFAVELPTSRSPEDTRSPLRAQDQYEHAQTQQRQPSQQQQAPRLPQISAPQLQMDGMQDARSDFVPSRPPPTTSQNMNVPVQNSRSREPSPLRERLFAGNAPSDPSQPMYARPNGSNQSLNRVAPSPNYGGHSRSSSRDTNSPHQQYSAGSGLHPSSPGIRGPVNFNQSPQSDSPRSSTYGRPSGGSPYSSPGDYYASSSLAQPLKSPTATVFQESRPDSSGSERSFNRPPNSFSAPRQPQPRAQVPMQQPPQPQYQPPNPPVAQQYEKEVVVQSSTPPIELDSNPPAEFVVAPQAVSQLRSQNLAPSARQEEQRRPSSAEPPDRAPQRPGISPQPTAEGNPAADAAYADFAARVVHMKGIFRLTAEKEKPSDRCTPSSWLRVALWWYLKGKSGLEGLLQTRPRSRDGQYRELLAQPHVDLAKTWWILSDPLEPYDGLDDSATIPSSADPNMALTQQIAVLRSHVKSLSLSMTRNQLLPPSQSLIQGQDTRIWLEYPHFTPDAAAVLGGTVGRSFIVDQPSQSMQPLEAIPLGDTKDTFCYGRFPVEVYVNTDEANTDRVMLPCTLSMLRGKRDFTASFVVVSQNELVNIKVGPRAGNDKGLSWHDVSWKASSFAIVVRLPRGFDLTVRMQEKDFRALWNVVEYARKVDHSLRPNKSESLVHEARLAELQYADSSNANAFPPDKVRGATALIFEQFEETASGGSQRKMHHGYRLLLVTDPKHKSLATVSHDVCRYGPLYYEFITDSAAHGMAAMVIRFREDNRQCRVLLVFPSSEARQQLYDVLTGVVVGSDETIVGKMSLASMNIEPATQLEGFTQQPHEALRSLPWQKMGITNALDDDPTSRMPNPVQSDSLRLVARHAMGCITDRMNMSKGELLIRLPCVGTPAIQILRNPQDDMMMSVDTRNAHPTITDGITHLSRITRDQPTIRTFTFASPSDLHAFQQAITGCTVRYDGLAATFGISRRMMVVPIYKKWEATKVRLQVVVRDTVVQVLAFMEDFNHADAMCFQVKSTDDFENIKGNGKDKKWAVRMKDAKFSLPPQQERERHLKEKEKGEVPILTEDEREERVRGRFVNLEGLEYAEEHDDITIGFETQEDRDRFAQALPAAATVGRGITLKRRI